MLNIKLFGELLGKATVSRVEQIHPHPALPSVCVERAPMMSARCPGKGKGIQGGRTREFSLVSAETRHERKRLNKVILHFLECC